MVNTIKKNLKAKVLDSINYAIKILQYENKYLATPNVNPRSSKIESSDWLFRRLEQLLDMHEIIGKLISSDW